MSLDKLRALLAVLQTAPLFAKAAAAEKALDCAVEILAEQDQRITNLEKKGAGDGSEKI